jgi:PIN domain nuclease of toxin-antitoxin system
MNILLDTHAFLWWVIDDSQLSNTAKATIADPTNTVYFSVISLMSRDPCGICEKVRPEVGFL